MSELGGPIMGRRALKIETVNWPLLVGVSRWRSEHREQ